MSNGFVESVSARPGHAFSKLLQPRIVLREGLGVEGDGHAGVLVQHRSRVAKNPNQPNLRQLHLIHAELFDELAAQGFIVAPGELGENVLTRGLALLDLPTGARLRLGASALVEVTGLRNPCAQIERFQPGLLAALLGRSSAGELIRKAGIMATVLQGGDVAPGDAIELELPAGEQRRLEPV